MAACSTTYTLLDFTGADDRTAFLRQALAEAQSDVLAVQEGPKRPCAAEACETRRPPSNAPWPPGHLPVGPRRIDMIRANRHPMPELAGYRVLRTPAAMSSSGHLPVNIDPEPPLIQDAPAVAASGPDGPHLPPPGATARRPMPWATTRRRTAAQMGSIGDIRPR